MDYPAATSAVRAHVILIVIADKIYDPFLTTHLCANVDHSLANLDPREELGGMHSLAFFHTECVNYPAKYLHQHNV